MFSGSRPQVSCGLDELPPALSACGQLRLLDLALNPKLLAYGGEALEDGSLASLTRCRQLDLSQQEGSKREPLRCGLCQVLRDSLPLARLPVLNSPANCGAAGREPRLSVFLVCGGLSRACGHAGPGGSGTDMHRLELVCFQFFK